MRQLRTAIPGGVRRGSLAERSNASADSTNIGRNIGIDQNWRGNYMPPNKDMRAAVMRSRIEAHNAPARWDFTATKFQPADQGNLL
jgi:hypothetical protein